MTRRALLIGAETHGLSGPHHDIGVMTAALDRRGFTDIRPCEGPAATRDGIIAAYERLIADTSAGDAAVVYYTGHGSYVWPRRGERRLVARNNRQFIVPTDFDESTEDDFRGVTAVELSVLLGRLTERTANVVVVLDCCHSALMSRDHGELRVRQLPHVTLADLETHVRKRLDRGLRIDLSSPLGNRHAVRVAACATDQLAFELPRRDGSGNYGLLTDALIRALDEAAGTRVSWSRLMGRVRQLVHVGFAHQRPEAEGPTERRLFEPGGDDSAGSLPVVVTGGGGRVRLDGAPLLGVQVGDEFALMPAAAAGPWDGGRIATVRIDRSEPAAASGRLVLAAEDGALPPDARAFRVRTVAPRTPARVPAGLAGTVAQSTFVRPAATGEEAPLEVVTAADGRLTVRDAIGPLHPIPRADEREVIADLDRVGRATALREIREESGWTVDAPVTVEWGTVRDGRRRPLPPRGSIVWVGEPVYVSVRNDGDDDLYVSLVDIGVSYAITVLTALAHSGVPLPAGEEYVFGWDDRGERLTGIPLTWPVGPDRGSPRPETVLALVTSAPQDLSGLHQRGVHGARSMARRDLLAHFGAGAARDFGEPDAYYCVRAIEFSLDPAGRTTPVEVVAIPRDHAGRAAPVRQSGT